MPIIHLLQSIVNKNCIATERQNDPINYWSEVIFAKCVFYSAPLSLMAIVPGILITLESDKTLILWLNIISFLTMVFVGYIPKIAVKTRKIILMALIYFAAFVLLNEMGNFGPGLVYLLSVHVLILVLFPGINAIVPFLITLTFYIVYGLLIHLKLVNVSSDKNINIYEWGAVSANVLFLGAIFSIIIPFLFSKIRALLEEKNQLLESEIEANRSLQHALSVIRHKNTELEQFVFVVSHDLQEPLRTISSFIGKLKSKQQNFQDEKQLTYLHFITDGAERMKHIITDLLDFSTIEHNKQVWEELNLNEIVNNYIIMRTQLIQEQSAVIHYNYLPIIWAPKVPLTRSLHSLLDNALKFTKKGQPPIVQLCCEERGHQWEFKVQDNGIGIDPQFFDKIFTIFQKLHNREEFSGTGIGLPVAKKNIQLMGGEIWVESMPGEGSTFYFTIPKTQKQ